MDNVLWPGITEQEVPWPNHTDFLDYELELGLVIGKAGRNLVHMYVYQEGAARDTGKPEDAKSAPASMRASVWRLSLPEHSGY